MTGDAWDTAWFDGGVSTQSMLAWRGVEAQHVISTMRLVDSVAEQDVLEQMLERSKPALPAMKSPKHYLLSTPFRYRPQHPSRFRRAGTLGLWYGAQELYAACAEVAYWRRRFVLDSTGLIDMDLLTEHTFFQAKITGAAVDLLNDPWVTARSAWTHSSDYTAPQALADAARDRGVQWIRYESVRAPGHHCAAVLDVDALEMVAKGATRQTWHCKASKAAVMMVRGPDRHVWSF